MKKEIEIVGAGPSGLVAAINLTRAGYKVTVYEEKADVGQRFHGDYQGLENWSTKEDVTLLLKRIGIGQAGRYFVCHPYNELTVFDANLNQTVIRSDIPLFYLVQRGDAPGCLDRGFQDCLWGFGLRYAMVSGYLAAMSIIENSDYVSLLKKELLPMQRISLVNRFIYEYLGNRGYAFLINWLARGDAATNLSASVICHCEKQVTKQSIAFSPRIAVWWWGSR